MPKHEGYLNYIIIGVQEPDDCCGSSRAGLLRGLITRIAEENGLVIKHNLIRKDMPFTYYGKPQPYAEAAALLEAVMPPKAVTRRDQDPHRRHGG